MSQNGVILSAGFPDSSGFNSSLIVDIYNYIIYANDKGMKYMLACGRMGK